MLALLVKYLLAAQGKNLKALCNTVQKNNAVFKNFRENLLGFNLPSNLISGFCHKKHVHTNDHKETEFKSCTSIPIL